MSVVSEPGEPLDVQFVRVPVGLAGDPHLRKTPLAVSVFCEVFRYERKRRAPYVGRKRLADTLGCSIDTVDRAVRALVTAGWVVLERRDGKTHYWYRGDGRTDAATNSRTDAAPIAAPMRPEVDREEAEEDGGRSIRVPSEPSRRPSAARRPRQEGPVNDLGFDLATALLAAVTAERTVPWSYGLQVAA